MSPPIDHKPVPYVPFDTFKSALDNLKGAPLEAKIRRTDCGVLSNANWGQLSRALRFLNLLDESHKPKQELKPLVEAEDRKQKLLKLLKRHYPTLFAADLSSISLARFDRLLGAYGVTGETLRRARSFFLGAVRYCEVPLSVPLSRKLRRRGERTHVATKLEAPNDPGTRNATEFASSQNKTVSLADGDMTFTLSFPAPFAELEKAERQHLYYLLDELVILKKRMAEKKEAAASQESELNPIDTLSDDSGDAPVH